MFIKNFEPLTVLWVQVLEKTFKDLI